MASTKIYLDYVLGQLAELAEVSVRPMMGEYILYYRDKVVGGVYDDRLLLKATPSAVAVLGAPTEEPYPGAKPMLMPDPDDRHQLNELVTVIYDELPAQKKR